MPGHGKKLLLTLFINKAMNFNKQKVDFKDVPAMPEYFSSIIAEYYRKMANLKYDFIISKITEKGFGKLLQGIHNATFPKIACIKYDSWEYYYADDGTLRGAFIVAISEYTLITPKYPENYFTQKMEINFSWQDKHGIDFDALEKNSSLKY